MNMNAKTKLIRENQKTLEDFLKRYPKNKREENGGLDLTSFERHNVGTMVSIYRIDELNAANLKFILSKFADGDTYPNIREKYAITIMRDAREAGLVE
ncbi:hypothetical protein [Lactococcus petauri]|uniref:hypothetical protein n=1 Tax=Lactococcus petauri TaxID=1940789 RepID=UPI00254E7C39|nr:hypothetical protein [Lactococcus petauri]